MEGVFNDMIKKGHSGVDHIVQWFQEANVIDKSKEAADKTKKMFSGVKDQKNVSLDEFKNVVKKIAEEKKTPLDQMSNTLAQQGENLMKAFGAAASAFKDKMK